MRTSDCWMVDDVGGGRGVLRKSMGPAAMDMRGRGREGVSVTFHLRGGIALLLEEEEEDDGAG